MAVGFLDALADELELVRVDDDDRSDARPDLGSEPARVAGGFNGEAVASAQGLLESGQIVDTNVR